MDQQLPSRALFVCIGLAACERLRTFAGTIRLPHPVAEKKVLAEYREGLLVVHLPKETPAPATKIRIK